MLVLALLLGGTSSRSSAQAGPVRATATDPALVQRLVARVQDMARTNDPGLRAQRADIDAQRATVGAAGFASPLTAAVTLSETPRGQFDQGNVGVAISRSLRQAPRLRAERRLSADELLRRQSQLTTAERAVRWAVVADLAHAVIARVTDARLLAEARYLAAGEDGVRARFGVGDAPYSSVLRVRTERLRVQSDRADIASDYRGALLALAGRVQDGRLADGDVYTSLGAVVDSLVAAAAPDVWISTLPAQLDSAALDSLVEQAAWVQEALSRLARARSDSALSAAMRMTQIESTLGIQRVGQANGGAALGPTLGVSVSLPFTAAAANRAASAAAVASIGAAERVVQSARMASRAEVRERLARFDAARSRLALYDDALLRGAREEREAALSAFRTGGLSLLELIDFERALTRADIGRLTAIADVITAYADLLSGTSRSNLPESTATSSFTAR